MFPKDYLTENNLVQIKDIKANGLKELNKLIEEGGLFKTGDLVRDNFAEGFLTKSIIDRVFQGFREETRSDYMVIAARYDILYF